MTRRDALEAVEEVLRSAMRDEKNHVLFQSEKWEKCSFFLNRAKSSLDTIEDEPSESGFAAFDFDVSIAELFDFIKENNL